MRFHELHAAGQLLVLPNAWDVASARLVERAGAKAVATASCAVAWSLGFRDGEHVPLPMLVDAVARMVRAVRVPVSVDLERGYGATPDEVARSVESIHAAGAAGVNLEDGGGDPAALIARIRAVRARVPGMFINARTCVLLHGSGDVNEVCRRAELYREADGFFVPGPVTVQLVEKVVRATPLPVNVSAVLPNEVLRSLGVRRVSAGPKIAEAAYSAALTASQKLLGTEPTGPLGYRELNA